MPSMSMKKERPCKEIVCVCVCVKPCLLRAKNVVRCSVLCFLLKQGAAGLSLTLRPTKTVIDRCVNVPARDAPGRNGRSWGSHMNPPLNSCINVGLSGRWAHDAHVWFFRTCRMRLDDAVGDLLTSWGRIQVCVCVSVCVCETRYNIRIFYNFVQRSKEDNMWRQ